MLIALVNDGVVGEIADYTVIFPDTSFPPSGPSDEFLAENGAMKVNVWLPYDQATQKLVPATPYIMDGWVYTVEVADKTPEEIRQEQEAFNAQQSQNRLLAYERESDPIFFKSQLGTATHEEWVAKREEVKAQYPYIEIPPA